MAKSDNGFLIFYDWESAFEMLDGKDCKDILMAMFAYSKNGKEPPKFGGAAQMAACFIFPAMKRRKESVENGRRGGQARAENAAQGEGVENDVENDVDNTACSTPLEPPLNPPYDNANPPCDNVQGFAPPLPNTSTTRQDKTRQRQDKTKQDINNTRQDEDKTVSDKPADVSSVVGLAREMCKWMDTPASVSTAAHMKITERGYTLDDYKRLFEMANESKFLRGGGERGWKATFDWLIEHMEEVTGGKYRPWEKNDSGSSSSFDTGEFFEAALKRSYGDDFNFGGVNV